jgi:hypothetical protein
MFKDQCRMYQRYRSQAEVTFGEVATVEFQAGKPAEPSLDFVQVPLIDIHSNHPLCNCGVNLFQTVAARYPQHCDTFWKTKIESALEEFSQRRQLLHACGTHVAFIVFQGYREPGIGHGLILGASLPRRRRHSMR